MLDTPFRMTAEGHYNDYRDLLRDTLAQRIAANPRYSLRAFARDLGIAPSWLSEILSHKRGLSSETALRIADRLESTRQQTEATALTLETFRVIADWYHAAILELVLTRGFKNDSVWIAKRLGITAFEAKGAIDRLLKLGLLVAEGGKLARSSAQIVTPHGAPSQSLRTMHAQLLQKAQVALQGQSVQRRDITSMTFAADATLVPEAKRRITEFRRSLSQFLESGQSTEVMCLSLQLFELTQPIPKEPRQ